jgi:hypothetical protein
MLRLEDTEVASSQGVIALAEPSSASSAFSSVNSHLQLEGGPNALSDPGRRPLSRAVAPIGAPLAFEILSIKCRRLWIEFLPSAASISQTTQVWIDRMMLAHDSVGGGSLALIHSSRYKGSATPDPFGVHVRVLGAYSCFRHRADDTA